MLSKTKKIQSWISIISCFFVWISIRAKRVLIKNLPTNCYKPIPIHTLASVCMRVSKLLIRTIDFLLLQWIYIYLSFRLCCRFCQTTPETFWIHTFYLQRSKRFLYIFTRLLTQQSNMSISRFDLSELLMEWAGKQACDLCAQKYTK